MSDFVLFTQSNFYKFFLHIFMLDFVTVEAPHNQLMPHIPNTHYVATSTRILTDCQKVVIPFTTLYVEMKVRSSAI